MDLSEEALTRIWDNLLSGEPEKVKKTFQKLPAGEKKAVLAHLTDMAEGEGWQDVQRQSAITALQVLGQKKPR